MNMKSKLMAGVSALALAVGTMACEANEPVNNTEEANETLPSEYEQDSNSANN